MQRRLQLSASSLSSRQTIPEMKIDQGPGGLGQNFVEVEHKKLQFRIFTQPNPLVAPNMVNFVPKRNATSMPGDSLPFPTEFSQNGHFSVVEKSSRYRAQYIVKIRTKKNASCPISRHNQIFSRRQVSISLWEWGSALALVELRYKEPGSLLPRKTNVKVNNSTTCLLKTTTTITTCTRAILGPVHTYPFLFETGFFFLQFGLPSYPVIT